MVAVPSLDRELKAAEANRRRLLFVVNVGWFFMSHRMPIAVAAREAGYDVHVAAALDPALDQNTRSLLTAAGISLHEFRLSRSGAHPLEIAREFFELLGLYRRLRPDIVHLVTLKPILLGGLAARFLRISCVVLAVPGRGSVFSARGVRATLRRWTANVLYRLAYRRGKSRIIIQNDEDRRYFVSRGVFAERDVRLIRGSGVDPAQLVPSPEPPGAPVVVLASRMLKEKGIADFVAAAAILRQRVPGVRCVLVGAPDHGNPNSHSREEIEGWAQSGVVEWWGFRSDIAEVFRSCHIVCLPTYYGEGVPKVLIEAAAYGRPIVTTDTPGCRDIVVHERNGLLIQPRDVKGLANALERLLFDRHARAYMGACGRERVRSEFTIDLVAERTIDIYRELAA